MFVAAATTDSTVVVDGAGIIIAGETMASMTGAVVGPGVNHSRYELHTHREVHTGGHKEECIYGQHEIVTDGSVGVVKQAEVSYSNKGLRHALYCLQETMSLVGQAFMKVLKEPT